MNNAGYFVGGDPPNSAFSNGLDPTSALFLLDQTGQVGYMSQPMPGWMGFDPNATMMPHPQFAQFPPTQLAPVDPSPESVGWGGQAIPDNPGYRVPWFGRPRGRNTNSRGGRGRGRNSNNEGQRNRQWNRARHGNEGHSSSSDDVLTVEDLVRLVRGSPENAPLSNEVYQGIRHFDSRTCSVLLKDLSKLGLGNRAIEVFDAMRNSQELQDLRHLCDVYTYTAMISMCIYQQDVDRALSLVEEMHELGVERNVHTYTALMNVCVKCGKCQLALDTYKNMREDRIVPNVVTYNTLIDIYGKMGQWEQAVKVLVNMKSEGVEAVLRTYNTLIISCNMCNQPREALAVYNRLLTEGFSPNATTYNALISAYGKAGQLDKVMEVFQEMLWKGCERSVITYSSLISACEKAGQWEIALELFNEMQREGCVPNTVTYNSLITACAQGAQWKKACEVFEQMRVQGCAPDVVTYTALISANERGGQWRRALQAYEEMVHQGCRPDAIVYNAIIDAVWETGVIWAQRKALEIFNVARGQGHFKQQPIENVQRAEVNLHALTAGVAVLSLYAWLVDLKLLVQREGPNALPDQLCIVTDKGRTSKEQGNLVVKEAVAAMMSSWRAPFMPTQDSIYAGILEANGRDVAAWLMDAGFEERLFGFFPCTNITPSNANKASFEDGLKNDKNIIRDDPTFANEIAVESGCTKAFSAVHHFESSHSLTLQAMGITYLQHRAMLVQNLLRHGERLNLREEIAHDAVLLMDRAMSTSIEIKENLLELLSVACLVLAMRQSDSNGDLPTDEQLEAVTDCKASAIGKMEWNLRQVLGSDTSAISTLRCIILYLERLGSHFLDASSVAAISGGAVELVERSMTDLTFLNCRPSVVAAAILYAERRSRGIIPFWPSMLAKLTGYQDMSSPELTVAIRGAQKLCQWTPEAAPNVSNSAMSNLALLAQSGVDIGISSGADPQALLRSASSHSDFHSSLSNSFNLGWLEPSRSLSAFETLNAFNSVQNLNRQATTHSQSADDDQVTANRVDGVVVAQGLAVPPRVVQGLSHVTAGLPAMVSDSHGFLTSNGTTTRMNSHVLRVSSSGGNSATDGHKN